MKSEELSAQLGPFEARSPEHILVVMDWLADGIERDAADRFCGYRGIGAALNIARAFVILGDCPEANAAAATEIGAFADYALDSLYWTGSGESMAIVPDDAEQCWQPTVKALIAMSRLATPIRTALAKR